MKLKPAKHLIPISKSKVTDSGVQGVKKDQQSQRNKMKTYTGDPKAKSRIGIPVRGNRVNYDG